ncbi:DNA ligase N terminus/ATP dependent DNA ligase domain/RNA ligase/ATP dependent DNA ligase C terminal region containing protein, putative [Angomonas deanei]|uniref:DNA ligase n=1 Tax=Angomonas deanei TaxID=59799 RepID=A0A7G2CGW9_9TRYP|nr:DNA ligase N terminus/ATP dependent DNA ligase domain/RNA ligase/ATP dependent DNA ligase C terminal region containing protein, putative [Angomonas deanei]
MDESKPVIPQQPGSKKFISPFQEAASFEANVKKEEVPSVNSFVSKFPFLRLCHLFESILHATSKNVQTAALEAVWKQLPKNESFFPYMRLLLPHLDHQRPLYNLKENKLAKLYVEVLGLPPKSAQAQKLLNWKDPSYSTIETTSFSDVVFIILQNKGGFNQTDSSTANSQVSVEGINLFLDNFATLNTSEERKVALIDLLTKTTPLEQKWLLRIILKDMKFRMTHQTMLYVFHPAALDKFNSTNDLLYVCDSCLEDMKRPVPGSAESGIFLFQPLRPMLASLVTSKRLEALLQEGHLVMEPKYDGERIMIHVGGDSIKYWTRNAKDYTPLYGPKFDPTVRECFAIGSTPSFSLGGKRVGALENVILDGEFLVFDKTIGNFSDFGYNRTFANAKEAVMITGEEVDGESRWFCYMVFDIVFLNGNSLMGYPYQTRREVLRKVLKQSTRRLEIVPSEAVKTTAEILKGLEKAVEDRKEGIVLKDTTSPYIPAERKNKWLKLKIDHLAGLADTMDLIIVGGYYGTKFGQRHLSNFMLAVWDNKSGEVKSCTEENAKFHTVCKIGNGYTSEELRVINTTLEPHLETMPNRDKIPQWLDGWRPAKGELIPDVYIHPRNSIVVEVFGFSFTDSVNYRVGYTVRFPRMMCIRWDKSFTDATDLTTLDSIKAASKDSLRQKMANGGDELLTVLSEKWKRRREVHANANEKREKLEDADGDWKGTAHDKTSLLPRDLAVVQETLGVATIDPSTELEDHLFSGYEFCVLFTSLETCGYDHLNYLANKTKFEKFLLRHGGRVAANPGPRTSLLIASTANAPKVANWIQMCRTRDERTLLQKYPFISVVHCSWVVQCVESGQVIPLSPRYMLYSSPSLVKKFEEVLDKYEDSYFDNCTVDLLRHSLALASKDVEEEQYRGLSLKEMTAAAATLQQDLGLPATPAIAAIDWIQPVPSGAAEADSGAATEEEESMRKWIAENAVTVKAVEEIQHLKRLMLPPAEKVKVEEGQNAPLPYPVAPRDQYTFVPLGEWSVAQQCAMSQQILQHAYQIYDAGSAEPPFLLVDKRGSLWKYAE